VNNTHYVEFVQLDGAGEVPTLVDHPTYIQADPIGYGVKVMELSRAALGVTQIGANPWQRIWTNGANPPDGYSQVVGTQATSRNSTAQFVLHGSYSWKFTHVLNIVDDATFLSAPVYPSWDPGHTQLSARAKVYFTSYGSVATNWTSSFTVYARTATGGLGASLGQVLIKPTNSTATATVPGTDDWVELKMDGLTLGPSTAPYGVIGVFKVNEVGDVTPNNSNITGYLGAIEWYQGTACPNDDTEFGDAVALLQSANNKLREVASPPKYYTFEVHDLARAFPNEYSRLALTLGGTCEPRTSRTTSTSPCGCCRSNAITSRRAARSSPSPIARPAPRHCWRKRADSRRVWSRTSSKARPRVRRPPTTRRSRRRRRCRKMPN
jgi:hypothetical protein